MTMPMSPRTSPTSIVPIHRRFPLQMQAADAVREDLAEIEADVDLAEIAGLAAAIVAAGAGVAADVVRAVLEPPELLRVRAAATAR